MQAIHQQIANHPLLPTPKELKKQIQENGMTITELCDTIRITLRSSLERSNNNELLYLAAKTFSDHRNFSDFNDLDLLDKYRLKAVLLVHKVELAATIYHLNPDNSVQIEIEEQLFDELKKEVRAGNGLAIKLFFEACFSHRYYKTQKLLALAEDFLAGIGQVVETPSLLEDLLKTLDRKPLLFLQKALAQQEPAGKYIANLVKYACYLDNPPTNLLHFYSKMLKISNTPLSQESQTPSLIIAARFLLGKLIGNHQFYQATQWLTALQSLSPFLSRADKEHFGAENLATCTNALIEAIQDPRLFNSKEADRRICGLRNFIFWGKLTELLESECFCTAFYAGIVAAIPTPSSSTRAILRAIDFMPQIRMANLFLKADLSRVSLERRIEEDYTNALDAFRDDPDMGFHNYSLAADNLRQWRRLIQELGLTTYKSNYVPMTAHRGFLGQMARTCKAYLPTNFALDSIALAIWRSPTEGLLKVNPEEVSQFGFWQKWLKRTHRYLSSIDPNLPHGSNADNQKELAANCLHLGLLILHPKNRSLSAIINTCTRYCYSDRERRVFRDIAKAIRTQDKGLIIKALATLMGQNENEIKISKNLRRILTDTGNTLNTLP